MTMPGMPLNVTQGAITVTIDNYTATGGVPPVAPPADPEEAPPAPPAPADLTTPDTE